MSSTLTTSGNEITDATRATEASLTTSSSGQMCEGITNDASFGIYRAATNLFRRGQCDTTTDISTTACTVATDATVVAPFSTQSIKITSSGSAVAAFASNTGLALAAGTSCVGSIYVKGVAAQSYQVMLRVTNTDASTTDGVATTFTATGAWQQITPAAVAVAVGKTGDKLTVRLLQSTSRSGEIFWAAHAMIESGQSIVAPYVTTSAGATAAHAAARVRAPASLGNATQMWAAFYVRYGFASTTARTTSRYLLDYRDDANNLLGLWLDTANKWNAGRLSAAAGASAQSAAQTFVAADKTLVVFACTATSVKVSVGGGAFVSAANSSIPTLAAALFDLGSQAGTLDFDGDVLWAALGTGTLTDTDAATLTTLAQSSTADTLCLEDITASITSSTPTAVWAAVTSAYQDEAFRFVGNHASLPRIRVDIDFDNDPTSATTTWTDVTSHVVAYSRAPVRSNEFDQPGATTASLMLRNDDARFIPDNTSGPYTGKLKKMRRVRVRGRWNGVDYNRFWGYAEDWPQSWAAYGKDQSVTLPLKDGFTPLETYDLVGNSFASASSGSAIAAVLTAAGITATSLDTGQSTIPASGTLTSTFALQRVHDIAASENGVAFADGGGTIQFHSRTHRLVNNSVVQGTIGDTTGEIPYVNPQPLYGDAWPIVRVTANGGTTETSTVAAGTASFYQRTLNFPTGGQYLVTSQSEALSAAQYLSSRYAAPVTRVASVELIGARDTTLWPTILGLKTSDRILFRRRFLSNGTIGGTVSVTGFVEGYGESVKVGDSWVVSVPISPADQQSYWILGNATYGLLGQTTYLGY